MSNFVKLERKNTMDLQTRKLKAIGYLINLQDEKLLKKIEETISENTKKKVQSLKPFTKKQLVERAKLANEDYIAGRFKTQEQLEIESEKW